MCGVEERCEEIDMSVDEKMNGKLRNEVDFEWKGFMEGVNVREFGIGEDKVIVKMRGGGWRELGRGKRFSIGMEVEIVGKGRR